MSLADAVGAALAKEKKAELVTGDSEFKPLEKEIKINWVAEVPPQALKQEVTEATEKANSQWNLLFSKKRLKSHILPPTAAPMLRE